MKRSISTRMILQLMPVILVIFVALIASAIGMAATAQKELAYQQGSDNAQKFASQFNTQLETGLTVGKTFAQALAKYEAQNREEVARMAQNLLDQNPEFVAVYAGYEPGAFDGKDARFVNTPGSDASGRFVPNWNRYAGSPVLDPLLDLDVSDYYQLPKTTRLEAVLEPFEYEGVMMTSYVSPIMREDEFIGIAGVDMSLAELDRQIKEIRSYTNGYAFLVSNSGTFISAPDESLIGAKTLSQLAAETENEQLADMAAAIKAGKVGFVETTDPFTDHQSVMFYSPILTGNLGLVSVVPVDEIMASVNKLTMTMAIIGAVSLVLLSTLVFFIARALAKPIVAVSQAASKISRGELDIKLNIHQQDEIGQMAENFQTMTAYLRGIAETAQNVATGDLRQTVTPISDQDILGNAFAIMIANLREQVRRVATSAENLAAASTQLASAAQQAGQATGQIAATIQQVARGTSEQSETITRTAASVDQMGSAISGVAKGAQEQASAVGKASEVTHQITGAIQEVSSGAKAQAAGAAQAVQTTRENAQTVQETISGMKKIKTQVDLSTGKVQEMGQRSQQIGMIVETIEDIASQTNLLALNAAIEAARAGEHGKGFAVVADEVRKLAEKSAGATKEIAALVRGIQQTVGDAVQAMNESTAEVEEGVSLANQSGEALVSLMQAAETSQRSGEAIAAAAEQMTRMANELVSAMDSVSAVVEENTAATEEMAAGSSEVTLAIENIASVSEENSAAVEEVSASTEEMSAQVEEVNASAQSLAEMAGVLQQMVSMFQLPVEQTPADASKTALIGSLPENGHKKNGRGVLLPAA